MEMLCKVRLEVFLYKTATCSEIMKLYNILLSAVYNKVL
jgi:hypothetical protein